VKGCPGFRDSGRRGLSVCVEFAGGPRMTGLCFVSFARPPVLGEASQL
jgi:hypothetical protein